MADTRTIEQTLTVDATPADVFQALTETAELKRWWISDGTSEPRSGGRFRYEWKMADPANDHVQEGTYDAVVDPVVVAFPWAAGPAGDTHVTFALTQHDGGTQLSLVHSGFAADPATNEIHERHDQGWCGFLANLKSVLEGGEDKRAAMGIQTER
jgi:uncharacterized protein YndB with AHSA1/START domain